MKKYKKCPHCRAKNDIENVVCINCNKVFNKKDDLKFLLKRIAIIIVAIIAFIGAFFGTKAIIKLVSNKKDKQFIKATNINKAEASFLEAIGKIQFTSEYLENKLIPVKDSLADSNKFKLIDPEGKVVYSDFYRYINDYNSFHIISKNDNNQSVYYIVDNNGQELYSSSEKIYYYPSTNSWIIGDKLYHNNKLISDYITISEGNYYDGYYYSFSNKEESGIVDYNGNITYKVPKKEHFVLEKSEVSKDEDKNYCLINEDYNFKIINCGNGEIVLDNKFNKIVQIKPNVFKSDGMVFYLNKKGKKVSDIESILSDDVKIEFLRNKYLIIGNSLYNRKTYNFSQFSPNGLSSYDDVDIENAFGTHKTYCKNIAIYYGLDYGFETLLDCNHDSISYLSYDIMNYLNKNNKLYAFVRDAKRVSLYDIKEKKIINDSLIDQNINSIFVTYKDNDHKYVYNLYDNTKFQYDEGVLVSIYSNYFILEKVDVTTRNLKKEYYNKEFNKIYTGI